MERKKRGWVDHSVLCIGALLGSSGSAGAAKRFRGHDGRLGPARVRRQGRKRRRWRGPQAKPRTRAPQRPLTGGAPAEARQAAKGGAQVAGPAIGENTFKLEDRSHPGRAQPAPPLHAPVFGVSFGLFSGGGRSGEAGSAACRGAKRSAAGMGHWPIPWRASAARSAEGAEISTPGAAEKKCAVPRDDAPMVSAVDQSAADATIDCNCSITPGSTKTQGWSAATGTLNTWANTSRFRWASRPVR